MEFLFQGWGGADAAQIDFFAAQYPQQVQDICNTANEICNNCFVFRDHWEMERTQQSVRFGDTIAWTHIPAGDPEWLYAFHRHTIFLNLAKAYRFTQNEVYAKSFVRLATDWLDHVPLTEESSANTWRSLEAGLRMENWLKALQLFSGCPAVPQALTDRLLQSMQVHKDYLLAASGAFQALSNWGVLQDYGLLLAGIALRDDACVQTAAMRLESEIAMQVFDDGSHWEQSPMYHCEVLHCFLGALSVGEKNGAVFSQAYRSRLHRMAQALAAWCKPDGCLPCQSDSDAIDARDLLAQAAVLFEDGALKFAAGPLLPAPAVWNLSAAEARRFAALAPTLPASLSTLLPDSGNAFLRSDATADAVWLHLHCGCLGSGHGHADLLHADVFAYGEDILIDSGRYTYVDGPLRRRLKLPAAHNTTRVDETDFSTCIDSWGYGALAQPLKGECKFTPAADYVSGGHLGYMALAQGSVLPLRKVVYVKPDVFVILDEFHTVSAHRYEQYFHFAPQGSVRQTPQGAVYTGAKATAELLCLGDGLALQWEEAPLSREYNTLQHAPCLTVSKSGSGFTTFATVLTVQKAGQPLAVTAELLPVTLAKAGTRVAPEKATALRICKNGEETVVLLCHQEIISEVDLLCVGAYRGYGKVIVFDSAHPTGTVLAW